MDTFQKKKHPEEESANNQGKGCENHEANATLPLETIFTQSLTMTNFSMTCKRPHTPSYVVLSGQYTCMVSALRPVSIAKLPRQCDPVY